MDYPQGTQELYDFLGAQKHDEGAHGHSLNVSTEGHSLEEIGSAHGDQTHAPESVDHMDPIISRDESKEKKDSEISDARKVITLKLSKINPVQLIKNSWPYILIFLVALFFYLALFTNFSVISFLKSAPASTKVVKAEQPQYKNLDIYNTWIHSYFYEVNDPKLIDPANDISGNGLSNYQKFVLGLNPKKQDTMGLGMTDTEALLEGINPLTGSALSSEQKTLLAQYVDLEAVANKLALQTADSTPKVAGIDTTNADAYGRAEAQIDTNIPAEVSIPKLKITVPLIWTKQTQDFDKDLASGVVHYPGTALPGEVGTAYVSGHSSNYSWAKGSYNKIFDTLNNLVQYDSFQITATDTNGKKVIYHYVVNDKQIYKPADQAQFASRNKSVVAISTCWPIGTSSKRLVVFGELSQTER